MKTKTSTVRLVADKKTVEITYKLPADALQMADIWAAKLGTTREEVLLKFAQDERYGIAQSMDEFCKHCWKFPNKKAAVAFQRREHLMDADVLEYEGGGWCVDTLGFAERQAEASFQRA
jgi:hypothetical protein